MPYLALIFICLPLFCQNAQTPEDQIRHAADLQKAGRLGDAAAAMRRLLATSNLSPVLTGIALNELGLALHGRNQFEEAERAYLSSIRNLESAAKAPALFVMRAHMNLSALYIETQRPEEAARERAAVSIEQLTDVADQLQALSLTAALALARGDQDKAYEAHLNVLEFIRRHGGEDLQIQAATALNNLGAISFRRGQMVQAKEWTKQAVSAQRRASGEGHPNLMKVLTNLAQIQIALHEDEAAAESLQVALNISRASLGDVHPVTATLLDASAVVLERTGLKKQAKAAKREAAQIRAELPRSIPASAVTIDVKAFTKSAR